MFSKCVVILSTCLFIMINGSPWRSERSRNFQLPVTAPEPYHPRIYGKVRFGMPKNDLMSSTTCGIKKWRAVGRDAEIVYLIATHINQLERCVAAFKVKIDTGEVEGDYWYLENDMADFYGSSSYWRSDKLFLSSKIRYLYPHARDDVCVLVTRATFIDRSIFDALSLAVWAGTGCSLLIFATVLRFTFNVSLVQAFFEMENTFRTGSFKDRHRTLMIWVSAFSLLILSTFSGVFTSFTMVPERGPEINSLADFNARYKLAYAFPRTADMIQSYSQQGSEDYKSVESKMVSIATGPVITPDDMSRMLRTGETALVDAKSSLELWLRKRNTWAGGIPLLRIVPQCLITPAYVSFAVRKDMAYADYYSTLIQRLLEGGIVHKLTERTWLSLRVMGIDTNNVYGVQIADVKVMDLTHFREAGLLLGCGLGFSTVVAIVEVLVGRARHVTQKRG